MGGSQFEVSQMYPTKEEFEEILEKKDVDTILSSYVFSGLPYSFRSVPEVHIRMIEQISRGLRVSKEDICIVGSARTGFSLSPLKYGEAFNNFSDIDVVVVSPKLFDPSWLEVVTHCRGPRSTHNKATWGRLLDHRDRHYVFNGWIYPNDMIGALGIGSRWLSTFSGLSRIRELSTRKVSGRLYRTWDHVKAYHTWSLQKLQESIVSRRIGRVGLR